MGTAHVKSKNSKVSSLLDPPKIKILLQVDVNKTIPVNLLQLTNCTHLHHARVFWINPYFSTSIPTSQLITNDRHIHLPQNDTPQQKEL